LGYLGVKLIFIHGSGGCRQVWHYQTKHFPDADAIDLPGHPEGELRTSVDGYTDWLRGYIQDRGYSDVVLAGHSLGSAIALLYALKYPEDLKGLVLIGGGARLRVHPLYLDTLEQSLSNPRIFEVFIKMSWELIDPDLTEILRTKALGNGPAVFLNDMLCCDKFDIMDRIKDIRLPTLALCGSDDTMTPPKYTKYLAGKIEGSGEVIIDGGTHMVFAEKPDVVNQAMEDFLNALSFSAISET
jgi:pimeloyl-ACP methyl ester carboxylesterase